MPATLEHHESHSLIRLEGECTIASAAVLKKLLLEGLVPGGNLRVDLERADKIDITVMQLLWAARRDADRKGAKISIRASDATDRAARDAGFEFPEEPLQG